mgnify:CR=1 FL=1|tara:strand:- start:2537 stop:2845 length:309 start_codon:yes stop_codon:yes gene_type:complete
MKNWIVIRDNSKDGKVSTDAIVELVNLDKIEHVEIMKVSNYKGALMLTSSSGNKYYTKEISYNELSNFVLSCFSKSTFLLADQLLEDTFNDMFKNEDGSKET